MLSYLVQSNGLFSVLARPWMQYPVLLKSYMPELYYKALFCVWCAFESDAEYLFNCDTSTRVSLSGASYGIFLQCSDRM